MKYVTLTNFKFQGKFYPAGDSVEIDERTEEGKKTVERCGFMLEKALGGPSKTKKSEKAEETGE